MEITRFTLIKLNSFIRNRQLVDILELHCLRLMNRTQRLRSKPQDMLRFRLCLSLSRNNRNMISFLYQGINQSGSSTFSVTGSVCGQVTQEKEEKKLIVLLQNFISPCKKVSSNCEP